MSAPGPSHPGSARQRGHERRATLQALISLAVAAYIGTAVAGNRAAPGVAAALYVCLLAGSVVLHEIGHALAVRAVGGALTEFRIGFGPVLLQRRVGGTFLDVRALVIAGHVGWRVPPETSRSRLITVAAAGPAVHLVLVLVAVLGGPGSWPVWRIDLLIANAAALASNLIPYQGSLMTTSPGHNDGAAIAALLRRDPRRTKAPALPLAATPAQRAAIAAQTGLEALGLGDREAAESLLHQAMSFDSGEPTTQAFAALLAATPPDRQPHRG